MLVRDLHEQEAKSLIAEAIGMLQIISQSATRLDKVTARKELIMAMRKLERADNLLRLLE